MPSELLQHQAMVTLRDRRVRIDLERGCEHIGGFRRPALLEAQDTEQVARVEMLARYFEDFTTQPFRRDQIAGVLKGGRAPKSFSNANSVQARRRPPCVHDSPHTSATHDRLA